MPFLCMGMRERACSHGMGSRFTLQATQVAARALRLNFTQQTLPSPAGRRPNQTAAKSELLLSTARQKGAPCAMRCCAQCQQHVPMAAATTALTMLLCLVSSGPAHAQTSDPSLGSTTAVPRLLQGGLPSSPLEPTVTHSPVMDIRWIDPSDKRMLAWTKAAGAEVGGLWYSDDGANTWLERTPSLGICPPEYPYLCAQHQVCYQDVASARACTGPEKTWCGLPSMTLPFDQISEKGWGTWCSNGCPANYPYLCPTRKVCYKTSEFLHNCSGTPGSWCALPGFDSPSEIPKYGSWCGNNATRGTREPVEVATVFADKHNPQNVVVFGVGSYIWTSMDYGQTFNASQTALELPRWRGSGIKSYKVHPWHSDWLLLLVKRPDCRITDRAQTECPYDLLLTKNLFDKERTWTNLTASAQRKIAGFVDFDWGAALCPGGAAECPTNSRVTDDTIFATMYEHAGDYDQSWDKDVHFVISHNLFADISVKMFCGNMFEVIGKSVYLAFANACPTTITGGKRSADRSFQGIFLYTSQDGGNNFVQACLPVALKQEGYELMSTHDGTGAIVIADFLIGNGYTEVPASSVYTAGPNHAVFSLSLTDAYRADYGFQTDFARVEGLPGVYIANQMVSRMDSDYSYGMDDTGVLVETRITFNGGGKWSSIRAPLSFNHARCNRCVDGVTHCYLHLRGMSTYDSMATALPAVYSNPSAPGFIMATGVTATIGMGLLDDPEGICTWLSTDGGVNWFDVAEGSYIYEFADWGGVIVMARSGTNVPTDEVRYSLDYGSSWAAVPLKTSLLVDNIRVEPDGQQRWLVIHGRACEVGHDPIRAKCSLNSTAGRQATSGLMYTLNIETLNAQMPKCIPNDYEPWSMATSRTDPTPACTLGKTMSIKRRVPSRVCYNGPTFGFDRGYPKNTTCNCTVLDVECDYGYIRFADKCTPIVADRMPTCPVIDSGIYTVSKSGKRLVHADVCIGVDAVIADTDGAGGTPGGWEPGPHHGGGGRKRHGLSGVAKFFITLLVLVVVCGAFVAWWIFAATERQRDTIRDTVSTIVAATTSMARTAYYTVHDRVRGRPADLHEQDLGYFQPLNEMENAQQPAGIFTLK